MEGRNMGAKISSVVETQRLAIKFCKKEHPSFYKNHKVIFSNGLKIDLACTSCKTKASEVTLELENSTKLAWILLKIKICVKI
jgi:hypothetical protein